MRATDEDYLLLDRWAGGEAAAGDALFRRHFSVVYRFLRNKVGDELEDLVQDTFLACIEGRSRFRGEASFRVYLLRIARFRLYAHYRERGRKPDLDPGVTSVQDLGTSPTGRVAQTEQSQVLLAALRQLPIELQTALELSFWEDLARDEIAAVLEMPPGTVASRIRRAKSALREVLQRIERRDLVPDGAFGDLESWAHRVRDELDGSRAPGRDALRR